MMKKIGLSGLILLCTVFACTERLELPPIDPLLVVVGLATNNGLQVNLSESVSKTSSNVFPKINDADVRVEDQSGVSLRLLSIGEGNYASLFQAIPGESYEIIINWKEEEYKAIAKMPDQVIKIDSVQHQYFTDSLNNLEKSRLNLFFRDSPQTPTYGLITVKLAGGTLGDTVFADVNTNGQYQNFRFDLNSKLSAGTRIQIEFAQLEVALFEYLRAINQLNPDGAIGGLTIAPPKNIIGNVSNEGLGFFGAGTIDQIEITIE